MFIIEIALGVALGIGLCAVLFYCRRFLRHATLVFMACIAAFLTWRDFHTSSIGEIIAGTLTVAISAAILYVVYAAWTGKFRGTRPSLYEQWHIEDESDTTSHP